MAETPPVVRLTQRIDPAQLRRLVSAYFEDMNEMNRAAKLLLPTDRERLRRCYERILALTDLTVEVNASRSLRRELLRWRDLVAERYIATEPDAAAHAAIFRALLSLHPEAWRQLPYVTLGPPA